MVRPISRVLVQVDALRLHKRQESGSATESAKSRWVLSVDECDDSIEARRSLFVKPVPGFQKANSE